MNIRIRINFETNFYYWVQAMCKWATYDAETRQYVFYRDTAPTLDSSQKDALKAIADVLTQAERPRLLLAELYFNHSTSPEAKTIIEYSASLRGTFTEVWKKEELVLIEKQAYFDSFFTSDLENKMREIALFLDSNLKIETTIDLYLLINPPFAGSIGHTIQQYDAILLHPAGDDFDTARNLTRNTALHEYVHLIENRSNRTGRLCRDSYDQHIKPFQYAPPNGYSWKSLYSEVLVCCFANNVTGGLLKPETYGGSVPDINTLKAGFYKHSVTNHSIYKVIAWVALQLQPDIEWYLESGKTIDAALVAKMYELISRFIIDKKYSNSYRTKVSSN